MQGIEVLERYADVVGDWPAFLEACQRPLPRCFWVNSLRLDAQELLEILALDGVHPESLAWRSGAWRWPADDPSIGDRLEFTIGLYHVQEEASMVPVTLLDPRPDERILDLCAAPGNKTAQIAVAIGDRGTIVANDRDYRRFKGASRTFERLGLSSIAMAVWDGSSLSKEFGEFDRILVDAPCNGEGTVRKHPRTIRPGSHQDPSVHVGIQRALLRRAVNALRPGGRLVYSTCTFAPEQNEMIVDWLLEQCDGTMTLVPARIADLNSAPGLLEWQGVEFDPSLENCLRVWPHLSDSGGFFAAVLEKCS